MGRRYTYHCDFCGKEFNESMHLNLKNGDLRVSFRNIKNEWKQNKVGIQCKEYHFCNASCLLKWIVPKIEQTVKASIPRYDDETDFAKGLH